MPATYPRSAPVVPHCTRRLTPTGACRTVRHESEGLRLPWRGGLNGPGGRRWTGWSHARRRSHGRGNAAREKEARPIQAAGAGGEAKARTGNKAPEPRSPAWQPGNRPASRHPPEKPKGWDAVAAHSFQFKRAATASRLPRLSAAHAVRGRQAVPSARGHADRAVEADRLAVEEAVVDDRHRELGVLVGAAEALREGHLRPQ